MSARIRILIQVDIDVDGEADDAIDVVDAILDAGVLQDAINDHDTDAGDLHVTSCVVLPEYTTPEWGVWGEPVSEECKRAYKAGWLHDGEEHGSADDGPFFSHGDAERRIGLVEDNPGWRYTVKMLSEVPS